MVHFHTLIDDATPINKLLFYSTQLDEDLHHAEVRRKEAEAARSASKPRRTVPKRRK